MTNPGTWRPRRFADEETDVAIQRIYSSHYALEGGAVQGIGTNGGYKQVPGTTSVKGSKTGIATGLSRVDHVTAVIDAGSTAVNEWLSVRPSPSLLGAIDIYVWKPTAAGDNTPVASTTSRTVRWLATGA